MSVLGLDSGYTVKYNPLPSGVPSGKGLYLTLYPLSHPNTDTLEFIGAPSDNFVYLIAPCFFLFLLKVPLKAPIVSNVKNALSMAPI